VSDALADPSYHRAMERSFDTVLARPLADGAEREFARALELVLAQDDAGAAIEGIRVEFARMDAPSDALLARVANLLEDAAESVRLAFWRETSTRLPMNGYAAACHGDALLDAGHVSDALDVLLQAVERRPEWLEDFDQLESLAEQAGGRPWLRYQLVVLRARLDRDSAKADQDSTDQNPGDQNPGDQNPGDQDSDDQDMDVREFYSELLEQYSGDRQAMAEIRALGERIATLEKQGVLPSVLVRRGDWRNE
jgi:hypothetical protein